MPKPDGARIRQRRQERGLSIGVLAARVGFANAGSLRNIESRSDSVSMEKLYRIARELGIAVDEVITDDEPTNPPRACSIHTGERDGGQLEPGQESTGKHRRIDLDRPRPLRRYEELVMVVRVHVPGRRSGLCLRCGLRWPCLSIVAAVSGKSPRAVSKSSAS
jgi:transcriptional regulator with XRE-family HTH domain